MKISIIGSGNVGSSIAYALLIRGTASVISLIDKNQEKALGEALDLGHGASFVPATEVIAEDYSGCRDADIIIITAGQNRKPNETRLDLIKKNVEIYREILPQILKQNPNPLIIVVSNPVDVLTYFTLKYSGLSKNRVIGSGTVLDSSRLRFILSEEYEIDPRNVHAYIIGEHGESAVAVWSKTNIAGIPLQEYNNANREKFSEKRKEEIFNGVVSAGREVIKRKGATFYAVALSVERIVSSIIRNEHSVLTVSCLVENYYNISDVCFSLPHILNNTGTVRPLHLILDESEKERLKNSAKILKDYNSELFSE